MPTKWSCGCRPAAISADTTAAVCISVSAVPPDFEIATKRDEASGSCSSIAPNVPGSRLSMKCRRGLRNCPSAGTAYPANCASVCPPRLEPPVPRNTTSVVLSFRSRA